MFPEYKLTRSVIHLIESHRVGYRVVGKDVISPANKILKFSYDRDGYPMVSAYCKGKSMPIYIHRLAAFQYYGMELFIKGNCVLHLDNDVTNFSKENIKVGSQSENEKQKYKSGLSRRKIKINPLVVTQIIELLPTNNKTEIAKQLGLTRKQVSYIATHYTDKVLKPNENYKLNLDSILF
jgi:hypothetical protein